MGAAGRRWAEQLAGWAIPDRILEAAPRSPYGFPTALFARAADEALARGGDTPTARVATAALPAGGSVLDVGCGAGAASLPLADAAGRLIGVDESADLLEEFASRAARHGVDGECYQGRWPDVAGEVPAADVVVCRNVAYNVPELDVFVSELTAHAGDRIVLELTAEHPLGWLRPYWRELHDVAMPQGPVTDDAVAVIRATGADPEVVNWEDRRVLTSAADADIVPFLQRRLCLADDRREDLEAALDRHGVPPSRRVSTLWWSGSG